MFRRGSDAATYAAAFRKALRRGRAMFWAVGLFTAVINVLALTGSLYMLQVYDRVIPSRSIPTLIGLTVLMFGLYIANGALDLLRTRLLSRIAARLDRDLREPVFQAVMVLPLRTRTGSDALQPIRDLDALRAFLSSLGPTALFDMPWMPLYLGIIYLLHPYLGLAATAGAVVLVFMTLLTEWHTKKPGLAAAHSAGARVRLAEAVRRNADVVRAMGLGGQLGLRWQAISAQHLDDQLTASDAASGISTISKVFRMVLQSGMLGLGAYVVVKGEATGGVMIASSIMTSRALAPIEIAIANWKGFQAARQARARLKKLFDTLPTEATALQLPPPVKALSVQGIWVAAPGDVKPIIQNVTFEVPAGSAVGVIGPSASGKSTLAKAIVGAWAPLPERGTVRLDGAALDQWTPGALGRHIGYLPQDIELFEGTIAENIARFDPAASDEAVLQAAQTAGVHDLILQLPKGYGTPVGERGVALSAGQRQRIALARAMYGDPFLVVLDEPNSNLDATGEAALTAAIQAVRARKGVVIVIAHRQSALAAAELVLAMAGGQARAFGPRDEVLAKITQQPGQQQPAARAAATSTAQAPRIKLVTEHGTGGE